MSQNVTSVRREKTLGNESAIRRSLSQFLIEKPNEFLSVDSVWPGRGPKSTGPECGVALGEDIPVNDENLVVLLVEPVQVDVVQTAKSWANFPLENSFQLFRQFEVMGLGEGVKVLEVEDEDLSGVA